MRNEARAEPLGRRFSAFLERIFPPAGQPAWFGAGLGVFVGVCYHILENIGVAIGRLDEPIHATRHRALFSLPLSMIGMFLCFAALGAWTSLRVWRRVEEGSAVACHPGAPRVLRTDFLTAWAKKDMLAVAIWLFYPLVWILPRLVDPGVLIPSTMLEKMRAEGFDPANRVMVYGMGFFLLATLLTKTYFFFQYLDRIARLDRPTAIKGLGGLALIVFFFTTLWAVAEYPPTGDEPHYLITAHSLIHDGDLNLRNNFENRDYLAFRDRLESQFDMDSDGFVARHEVFFPLLITPAYALGGRLGVALFLCLLAALTIRHLSALLDGFFPDPRFALRATGAIAFLTPFLTFSGQIYPETMAALLLVLALRIALSRGGGGAVGLIGLIACVLALPVLKARFALLSVSILVFAFFVRKRRGWTLAAAPAALLVLLGALFLLDHFFLGGFAYLGRFKVALRVVAGQYSVGDFARFLSAGLYDQGGGVIPAAPIMLLVFFGLASALFSRWREALLFLQILLLYYFVKSPYWESGWSPAGRYVICLLPAAAWFMGIALERTERSAFARRLVWTLAVLSGLLTAVQTLIPPLRYPLENGLSGVWGVLESLSRIPFTRFWPAFATLPDRSWNLVFSIVCTFAFFALGLVVGRGKIARTQVRG